MDGLIGDWLGLAIRWAHIITGIAWIGSSFFFMWLDSHLDEPAKTKKGVEGELWMVHSGGFYETNKIVVAPKQMPKTLHWFVWEATFTWITGVLLLIIIYYLGAQVFMVDKNVADISPGAAVAISVGSIVVAWFAYDALWASPAAEKHEGLVNVFSILAIAALAYGFAQVLSGRAAFIQIGALMGTLMAANVWRRIIPAQKGLVAASKAGTVADPSLGLKAKQRSVHNNYMTLPVLFCMISTHYPMTFGHRYNWAILLILFAVGGGVRHYFNLRNKGQEKAGWPYVGGAAIAFLALAFVVSVGSRSGRQNSVQTVAFVAVEKIMGKHCVNCHAVKPTKDGFDEPPKGVVLEKPDQVQKWAAKILKQTVVTRAMPLGNESEMTDAERQLLGAWIRQGAKVD